MEVGFVTGQEVIPGKTGVQPPAVPPGAEHAALLDAVEQELRSALRVLDQLREELGGVAPPRFQVVHQNEAPPPAQVVHQDAAPPPAQVVRQDEAPPPAQEERQPSGAHAGSYAPFERLWDRLEQERLEKQQPAEESEVRGLDLLPRQYLMTVEDRERAIDLVPLHRALQKVKGVQEVTLISFANGVPVVSVRTDRELDLEMLEGSVVTAMARQCEVIPQNNGKIFLRLKPAADRGE